MQPNQPLFTLPSPLRNGHYSVFDKITSNVRDNLKIIVLTDSNDITFTRLFTPLIRRSNSTVGIRPRKSLTKRFGFLPRNRINKTNPYVLTPKRGNRLSS